MAAEYSAPACTAHKSFGIVQTMHLSTSQKEFDEDDLKSDLGRENLEAGWLARF